MLTLRQSIGPFCKSASGPKHRMFLLPLFAIASMGLTACGSTDLATAPQATRNATFRTLDFARFVINAAHGCAVSRSSQIETADSYAWVARAACRNVTDSRTRVNADVVGADCDIEELADARFTCDVRLREGRSIALGTIEVRGSCARFGQVATQSVLESQAFSERQMTLAKTAWIHRRARLCRQSV